MELNREQIIKAWECCGSTTYRCEECPIDQQKKDDCICGGYLAQCTLAIYRELTEENEKLNAELKRLTLEYKGFEEGARTVVKFIKEATVRKMQDMLTTFFRNDETLEYSEVNADYINEQIDQIAKDLLEGNQLSPP